MGLFDSQDYNEAMLLDKHGNPIKNNKNRNKRLHNFVNWSKRKFLSFVGVLALFATIVLNLSQIKSFFASFFSKPEIVDVTFEKKTTEQSETGREELPEELSLKLRNPTDQVIFFKKVVFEVENIWDLNPSLEILSIVEPTARYDISLPNKKTPFTIEKDISQKLGSEDVDRFNFIIKKSSEGSYIVRLKIRLYYNSGFNNYIESSNIIISMLDPDEAGYFRPSYFDCNCKNLDSAEQADRADLKTIWRVGLIENCRIKNEVLNSKNVIFSDLTLQLLK